GLADTGATEQADLAALGEGTDQVDHLDTGLQQFVGCRQILVIRRVAVDGSALLLADRTAFVDRVAQYVHDPSEGLDADRYRDRGTGIGYRQVPAQTF